MVVVVVVVVHLLSGKTNILMPHKQNISQDSSVSKMNDCGLDG
jgi:hypothetical protein